VPTSPVPTQPGIKRFGGFELDLQTGVLSRDEQKNRLQGQPLQLLELLLQHAGSLVTREQIQEHLWPDGTVVEFEHSVNAAVKRLRSALDDDAENPTFIETIPRRGYRFIAHVETTAVPRSAADEELLAPGYASRRTSGLRRRIIVMAGVAALLVAAVLVSWLVYSRRPALAGTDIILLANFVNNTGDSVFDNSLDKALEVKLTESPFLSIFPEADARATMRTMRHDPNERLTQELGIEICKRQGIKALVVPKIVAFGGRYLITLEAIDAHNQKTISLKEEEAESKDKVIAALGKAASQLRRRLGESLSSLEKYNAPLDQATTSSLDALQAYRTGQALYRSGKRRESIVYFERAVELDPQFCSAYAMLGSAYHSVSDEEASRRNFAAAFALKDRRLTQEENFQTTALYHLSVTGNVEKASAILFLYRQAYPRSANAANLLGIAYARLGKTQESLQEFYWAIDHSPLPSVQHYSNATLALMILGNFSDAKKMLERWRQKQPLSPILSEFRYQIAFFENDVSTMERIAHDLPADDGFWLHLQMRLAFLRGDFTKLRSLSDIVVEQQRHAKKMDNVASELASHAWTEATVENYPLARQLCRQAAEVGNNSAIGLVHCAEALGAAGDVTQAEALAAKADRLGPEDTFIQKICLPEFFSIIERGRGNAAKAADLLGPATQFPNGMIFYERGLAYSAAGDQHNAVAHFEKSIGERGWPGWGIYAPLAQLGLARTYALQQDREHSRRAYDQFFNTWKDADPDIPILRKAKLEYKKLIANASAPSRSGKTQ
jgi:DNA-binding winged helix-turn-helix (wHTH) protein/tetratricopeptide (TPR) repeat protein